MILDFEPGDKVINPNNKDWGIGQVQSIIKEIEDKWLEKNITNDNCDTRPTAYDRDGCANVFTCARTAPLIHELKDLVEMYKFADDCNDNDDSEYDSDDNDDSEYE